MANKVLMAWPVKRTKKQLIISAKNKFSFQENFGILKYQSIMFSTYSIMKSNLQLSKFALILIVKIG